MNIDIANQINAIDRKVESLSADANTGERIGVSLRRNYDAPIDDVWNAITDPARLKRWFMPVTGEVTSGLSDLFGRICSSIPVLRKKAVGMQSL